MLRLAEHPNIVGLKDCGADRAQSIELLRGGRPGFRVLTGEDAQYFDALTDGADGGILLSAHIETDDVCGGAHARAEARRPRRGAGALAEVAELTRLLFTEPSPAPAKYWLWRTRTDRQRRSAPADGRSEQRNSRRSSTARSSGG